MNEVNKTLYIPLYGKAFVSKKGIILSDKSAERIWESEGFALKGKSKSKWLAYYMGMRSRVFDDWIRGRISNKDSVIIHLGCGLDSRNLRVEAADNMWYDVDFHDVISEREKYFSESDGYKMIGSDIRDPSWLDAVEGKAAIVIMEGVSMYLTEDELCDVLSMLYRRFDSISLLMDCYTTFAAKASKVKNPINDVGVTKVYGMDDPKTVEISGLNFVCEHEMTPGDLINELSGMEKSIFRKVYGGKMSKKLYRLYEYQK